MKSQKSIPFKSYYRGRNRYSNQSPYSRQTNTNMSFQNMSSSMQETPKKNPFSQPQSSSSQMDEQVLTMNWNLKGQLLGVGLNNEIKIWELLPQSGLKVILKKQLPNFEAINIKFVNDNIFGCFSGTSVRFWDIRQGVSKEISIINGQIQQEWDLFEVSQKSQFITLGGYEGLKNYDFRKLKNNHSLIGDSAIEMPLFDMKWYEEEEQILLTVGGVQNKGILSLYNKRLQELTTLELNSSPIKSMSLNRKLSMMALLAEENTIQVIQMPEILCCSVIEIPEEANLYSCSINYDSELIAVISEEQTFIYKLKSLESEEPQKIPIFYNSPVCWHPTQDMLTHISKFEKNFIALTKIKK